MSIPAELLQTQWQHGVIAICAHDDPDCKGYVKLGWYLPDPADREKNIKPLHTVILHFKITNMDKFHSLVPSEQKKFFESFLALHVLAVLYPVGPTTNFKPLGYVWH